MIKIKNLTKSFGDAKILKGINLEIKQNEFCVLLGGSGSGKTTLLNILSGTSELSSGEISMQNKIYTKKISLDKSRQIITQTYSLMPWLSAKDNIKFALKCSGIKDKFEQEKTQTTIFVTHDIDEALFLADKIVILHDGVIIKEIINPNFGVHDLKYFELKAKIFDLINGEDNEVEYTI